MVLTEIFCKRDAFSSRQETSPAPGGREHKEQLVRVVATHFLRGLVHALHGWSSAVVQEEGLLPVVVVGLQDVPAAQLHVDPAASSRAQVRR